MVTPGLAGFPLQAQSTGLSNNIPKRIATSQKGMIVLPTQNESLTDQYDPERIIENFDC